MKKRVSDLTVEEMVTVFRHLDDGKKRTLLKREYGGDAIQVTKSPTIYRDVLSIIALHINLQLLVD